MVCCYHYLSNPSVCLLDVICVGNDNGRETKKKREKERNENQKKEESPPPKKSVRKTKSHNGNTRIFLN